MDFDRIAEQYPVLYDLMGIASQMRYQHGKEVVADYIGSILKKLGIPADIRDFEEVMGLYREAV